MKAKWVVTVLIAAGVVLGIRSSNGCGSTSKDPDEKLVAHLEDVCEIMRDHRDVPVVGLRKLGRYLYKHTGDIYGNGVQIIAFIEGIEDDDAHDERARLARDRIDDWANGCAADWFLFWQAVEADPEATELVDRTEERVQRTIDILSGQGRHTVELRRVLEDFTAIASRYR